MSREKGADEIYCRTCGEIIKRQAEICPECGVANEAANASSQYSSTNDRSHETIFCRSCGEEIIRQAEICPHCGVKNSLADSNDDTKVPTSGRTGARSESAASANRNVSSSTASQVHDPSNYSTTVSENWQWGIAASVVLWALGMVLPETNGIAGLFLLVGWTFMPVSVYYDAQWLRANTMWNPSTALWVIGSVVPPINIVVGIVYLFRRYNTVSNGDGVSGQGVVDQEDDALAVLRRRYSKGEINDTQFEARVEKILETEDRETARHLLETDEPEAEAQTRR